MTEPTSRLADAIDAYEPSGWDDAQVELQWTRMGKARRRQKLRRGALAAAAACAGLIAHSVLTTSPAPLVSAARQAADEPGLRFQDGSLAMPLGEGADVVVEAMTPNLVRLRLDSGSGYFEVTPDPERRFIVMSGRVYVLGSEFRLERQAGQTVVDVIRGDAEIHWETDEGGRTARLRAGDSGVFPPVGSEPVNERDGAAAPLPPREQPPSTDATRTPRRPRARGDDPRPPARSNDWRALARGGEFDQAYERLRIDGSAPVGPEELMLAADAARRSGHGSAALPFLNRVHQNHSQDPRAPLAAFTAGRILLRSNPGAAARMFARTRALGASPRMAQDAMAREVEAASRAGDSARAARVGRAYLSRHPQGRRANAVRRWAGLE